MSLVSILRRQTSISPGRDKVWCPRRHLSSSSSPSTYAQARPSLDLNGVSEATQPSSLVNDLQELTELSSAKTRAKGRQRLPDRYRSKNSIEDYLGHLQKTKHELTLEDIERCRPKKIADPNSSDYETAYNDAVGSLMKSFSQPQLQQFLQLYDLQRPHHRSNKRAFAVKILEEKWDWPSLEKVSQDRIDWSEVSEHQFYLDPAQSFLLMGKDGNNLLSLSRRYNVSLSFTVNPMSLRVTGLKGALKQVEAYLETLKKDIDLEIFPLPFSVKLGSEMEQSISRLGGAYVKTMNDNQLSISFLKSQIQTLSVTKQLIMQVATEKVGSPREALYLPETLLSGESSRFSLFPFSALQPLSWQTPYGSTFRYRRIGTWTDATHLPHPDKLSTWADDLNSVISSESTRIDLKEYLTNTVSKGQGKNLISSIDACFGHILFLSPSAQRVTLVPPLMDPVDPMAVLQWAKEYPDRVVFSPHVPKAIHSASAHKQQYFRKLIYQAETAYDPPVSDHPLNTLTIEVPQVPVNQASTSGNETSEVRSQLDHISCVASTQRNFDILIPTRQADLRFSTSYMQVIPPSDFPEALRFFLLKQAQPAKVAPDSPLSLTHLGVNFFLHSNSYVRRQHKKLDLRDVAVDLLFETVFYPESGQTVTYCKIICEDHSTPSGWKKFIHTCDLLMQPREAEFQRPAETFSPFEV